MATSKSFLPNLWNSFSAKIWQRVMYVDLQFQNIPRHSLLRKISLEVNRLNKSIASRPLNVKWYFCLFWGNKIQRNNYPKPDFWMRIIWYGIFCKIWTIGTSGLDHSHWSVPFRRTAWYDIFLQVICVVLHLAKRMVCSDDLWCMLFPGSHYINFSLIAIQGSMDLHYQVRLIN